jgi:hypothetical protein
MSYRRVVYRNPRQSIVQPTQERPAVSDRTGTTEKLSASPATYGAVFQRGTQTLTVSVPGGLAAVCFSDNALLEGGIAHDAGASELFLHNGGNYEIGFSLHIVSQNAVIASFMVQANAQTITGGLWEIPLHSGYQSVSGVTAAKLNAGTRIRIVMSAASPLEITMKGTGTVASMRIQRLT